MNLSHAKSIVRDRLKGLFNIHFYIYNLNEIYCDTVVISFLKEIFESCKYKMEKRYFTIMWRILTLVQIGRLRTWVL